MGGNKSRRKYAVIQCNRDAWDMLAVKHMNLDTNLVRCQKYLFPEGRGKRLLYIGFGEGQNLIYLTQQGFTIYGTEIAKSRIRETKKKLEKEGLAADLRLVESTVLPFESKFFDVVVAWQSLYYNNKETLTEVLSEIERVLKPGGQFLSSVLSVKQKLLCNRKIAPFLYRPAKKTGQQNCVVFCFRNKEEIRRAYKNFKNIRIGFYASNLFCGDNFHYVVHATKTSRNRKKI